MKQNFVLQFGLATLAFFLCATTIYLFNARSCHAEEPEKAAPTAIDLPAPNLTHDITVEQAMQTRRSVRSFTPDPLTLQQVSNLLWAAQGITDPAMGHRTAPSAMAKYPLTVYLFAGNIDGLASGVYKYIPEGHKIELVTNGDQRNNVGTQPQMYTAPASILYVADYSMLGQRAPEKSNAWADIEVGHSAQNVLLEEVVLGLAGVGMGGFDPVKVASVLGLPSNETPVYIVSAGYKGTQQPTSH
jgi:SagB-type dehydrogenase family enzyme